MEQNFCERMDSSSSHNNGIPLAVQLEWYKIRDTLLGENFVEKDIEKALQMAASCQHPDAVWLTKVCAGREVWARKKKKKKNAPKPRLVFSAIQHPLALALAWCFAQDQQDVSLLHKSAEQGCAFGQALLSKIGENMMMRKTERESPCCWL